MPKSSSPSVKVFWPRWTRAELIELLRSRLPELAANLPVSEVTLFGSWAAGRATAFSDVDLLVVYSGPRKDEAYEIVRRCVDVRGLEPHVYSVEEAEGVRRMLDAMTRGGVKLL